MNWQNISDWHDLIGIISDLATAMAIVIAGVWFLYTRQYLRRVQFDLECDFFAIPNDPDHVIAEIKLIFENKGTVKHYLYNLFVFVRGIEDPAKFKIDATTQRLSFDRCLIEPVNIVPKNDYYFIRPSVRQVITHVVRLNKPGPCVEVSAIFYYEKLDKMPARDSDLTPHSASKVFALGAEKGRAETPGLLQKTHE